MMIGECARNFEILPCILDVDILRNILYDGVWKHYRKIQEKKAREKEEMTKNPYEGAWRITKCVGRGR